MVALLQLHPRERGQPVEPVETVKGIEDQAVEAVRRRRGDKPSPLRRLILPLPKPGRIGSGMGEKKQQRLLMHIVFSASRKADRDIRIPENTG